MRELDRIPCTAVNNYVRTTNYGFLEPRRPLSTVYVSPNETRECLYGKDKYLLIR